MPTTWGSTIGIEIDPDGKSLWTFDRCAALKVRYRGITKNGAQVFSLLALANLYLARRTFAST
jgi:hypothetical protein